MDKFYSWQRIENYLKGQFILENRNFYLSIFSNRFSHLLQHIWKTLNFKQDGISSISLAKVTDFSTVKLIFPIAFIAQRALQVSWLEVWYAESSMQPQSLW